MEVNQIQSYHNRSELIEIPFQMTDLDWLKNQKSNVKLFVGNTAKTKWKQLKTLKVKKWTRICQVWTNKRKAEVGILTLAKMELETKIIK